MTSVGASFRVQHEKNPAEEIREAVGNLDNFKVGTARLLLGLYKRPDKVSGVYRPDKNREEDVFQAKACLVLKCGPNSFKNDATHDFGGFEAKEGDWVLVRMQDGRRLDVSTEGSNGWECLLIKDYHVQAVLPTPWCVW